MIYVTGDKHANFNAVFNFCHKNNTSINDLLIILGDAGINYFASKKDQNLKEQLKKYPVTLFCIHGNHEERPENIETYKTKKFHDGIVYYEDKYPNILFAKDGEIYVFNNRKVLVIGGAYSVDKYFRLKRGYRWYESEQLTSEEKDNILNMIKQKKDIDIVLSHTCPYNYLPREVFLSGIDQRTVDNSMELFLNKIEESLNYKIWYCGHYHIDKKVDRIRFMFNDIDIFDNKEEFD